MACRLPFVSSISGLDGGCSGPGEVRGSPGAAGSPSRPAWNTHAHIRCYLMLNDDRRTIWKSDHKWWISKDRDVRFSEILSSVTDCVLPGASRMASSPRVSDGGQYPKWTESLTAPLRKLENWKRTLGKVGRILYNDTISKFVWTRYGNPRKISGNEVTPPRPQPRDTVQQGCQTCGHKSYKMRPRNYWV